MAEINFHHPYTPYDIQKELMSTLYSCIEDGKVGIFESPTGTGKSLSLICGSLTWLRDHKKKTFETGLQNVAIDDDEPDWVREQLLKQKRDEASKRHQELEAKLAKIRENERKIRQRYENGEPQMKRRKVETIEASDGTSEDEFLLNDYDSDDGSSKRSKLPSDENGLTAETIALMTKLGYSAGPKKLDDDLDTIDEMKIFYCSRTHSQLSQFASELKRVKMPPAITMRTGDDEAESLTEDFKYITLGSRKNLCINPKVNKLDNATAINERCLELQQPSTPASSKCPHVPTKETEALVHDFRDHALAKVRDIEDLGKMGKKFGICPYYASRPAVKPAEIVTLPYPLLLQRSAREALDISLKGHVVIIDEAHNLLDSITGIHSASVSLSQLQRARGQLMTYLQKFKNRLKGKNRTYVAQTVRLFDSLVSCLTKLSQSGKSEGNVEIQEMMSGKGVDQIDIYRLDIYLSESKLARKVQGYVSYEEEKQKTTTTRSDRSASNTKTTPVLMQVQSFLLALMNPSSEGRFFFSKEKDGEASLRYLLLDPTHHFREIVEDARSVILIGGTMSPMSDFTQHLFSYVPPGDITTLSCGHVIPASNLLALPVIEAANGTPFDFTFEKRNSTAMIIHLGRTILSLISSIPDGVVVFFPSYTYLDTCVAAWKKTPLPSSADTSPQSLYTALEAIKPIFLESRSHPTSNTQKHPTPTPTAKPTPASTTDALLTAYSAAIHGPSARGALLLAVMSGSLSEGINFSDRLGRGVLVVGLPFANAHTAEWKAKLEYITASAPTGKGKEAAREYYENACMRAVNQSVGRAIRHRGDYAAIVLLDRRYASERVKGKLSGWVRGSLREGMGTEGAKGQLRTFFEGRA